MNFVENKHQNKFGIVNSVVYLCIMKESNLISHDRLLSSGFELIHSGSYNVYELTNDNADGCYLHPSVSVGEYKDPNSPYKYWMVNGAYQLPDLKENRWDLLKRSVKNTIGLNLEDGN